MSGVADLAPYTVNGTRLALTPIRFGPGPGGSTALSTVAQLDGPFPNGRVQALRLPITGRIGPGGSFAFGTSCAVVSFNSLKTGALQLGPTRLPVCPIGPAIIAKRPGGAVLASARFSGPVLNGRIGSSPLHLAAAGGQIVGKVFSFDRSACGSASRNRPLYSTLPGSTAALSAPASAGSSAARRRRSGMCRCSSAMRSGSWQVHHGDLAVDSALTVSDRDPNPRFYPLKSNDVHFTLAGDYVRATGALNHGDGTLVTDVSIEHQLSSGAGHADLDVPGLTFGPNLQPDELTRLTEGVIALVNGTISGHGRIDWASSGKVTSTGDFSTASLDLAAPFGPVTGNERNDPFQRSARPHHRRRASC